MINLTPLEQARRIEIDLFNIKLDVTTYLLS